MAVIFLFIVLSPFRLVIFSIILPKAAMAPIAESEIKYSNSKYGLWLMDRSHTAFTAHNLRLTEIMGIIRR